MTLDDLFPICADQKCPLKGQHKHPTASQLELIHSADRYIYQQGGYGSAKTLGACALGVLLSLQIPGNRGIVIRETYPKLHDNTQRVFMEMLERAKIRWTGRENRDGWYHRVILKGNKSEIHFREGRTVRLGADYGWFFVDEASEVEERLFKNLQARLRLPAAGKFLRGFLTSNPPHVNHWLHKVFGEHPGAFSREVEVETGRFEQTTFRFMRVSTRANPHNPPGYLADLLTGLTQTEIARLVEGDYGYIPDGPPAYPQFENFRHVGIPAFQKEVPLVRGWDFGFRHPAVTFHQFARCLKRQIHWTILDAMDGRMVEAVPLAESVATYTRQGFPGIDPLMIEDVGDRTGARVSDTGPGPIIQLAGPPHNLNFAYKDLDIEPGLRMIRDFLRLPKCDCGESRFLVHRKCRYVIEGFQGGYHMKKDHAGKAVRDEPQKDGFYDDFMDSVRYAAEHHLRPELVDDKLLDALNKTDPRRMYQGKDRDPWRSAVRKLMARQERGA